MKFHTPKYEQDYMAYEKKTFSSDGKTVYLNISQIVLY